MPAAVVGLAAACLHVHGMAGLMRRRNRRDLGTSFLLIRLSWVMLPASLVLGLLLALDLLPPWGPPLFALTLVGGWLLSLVLGMLQRILPFLAAIHAARAGRRIPKVSELSTGLVLQIQTAGHVIALVAGRSRHGAWPGLADPRRRPGRGGGRRRLHHLRHRPLSADREPAATPVSAAIIGKTSP